MLHADGRCMRMEIRAVPLAMVPSVRPLSQERARPKQTFLTQNQKGRSWGRQGHRPRRICSLIVHLFSPYRRCQHAGGGGRHAGQPSGSRGMESPDFLFPFALARTVNDLPQQKRQAKALQLQEGPARSER